MAELFFLFLLPYPRICSSFFSPAPDKPPSSHRRTPLEKFGKRLEFSSSFLVKSQDLRLRIFPLNPENPGSALLFSPVRRLLCGWEILGLFLNFDRFPVSFLLPCRRPFPNLQLLF
ncbi:hypothetical protein SLEP1_g48764 [Rubroshorea leprosula]|uniref:Uncharacterized protein n=1 Tax=Rubroshorea leprosula TaxID=152421 RepID=A0AAV5LUP1_9ROSI|nr:hypothetical protein SLEP1_g48764 [Rubroshorea leprosula]